MDFFLRIILGNLTHPQVETLLQEHLDDMYATSPPDSVHALDLSKLQQPNIRFWTAWQDNQLQGCGALSILSANHGEIKSMRTARAHLRQGVAAKMLAHIIQQAKTLKLTRLSLETGSQTFFQPAIRLYQGFGFEFCGPFANYVEDPNSKFMTLVLGSTDEL